MLYSILILVSLVADLYAAIPYFSIRSQGQDTARELAGWTQEIHPFCCDVCEWYLTVASTTEYAHSFNGSDIACCLLDSSCLNAGKKASITISGSRVPGRNNSDWLADYFGLSPDFTSVICLSPYVQSTLTSIGLFSRLNNIAVGFFVKAHMPIVTTRWSLDFCEDIINSGSLGYEAGYITDASLPRNALLDSFSEFITGVSVPQVNRGLQLTQAFLGDEITSSNAIVFESLRYAKWADQCCKSIKKTKIADIHYAVGYELYNSESGLFAPYIALVVPTGNRPEGEFFLNQLLEMDITGKREEDCLQVLYGEVVKKGVGVFLSKEH